MSIVTLDDVTVQNVKDYYSYTDSNKDNRIAMCLPMARDLIYGFCNSDFQQKSRTEKPVIENNETINFFTKFRPITSVTSLTVDGNALNEDIEFFAELETGRIEKIQSDDPTYIYNRGNYWTTKRNAINITYVGGQILTQDVLHVFYELVGIYTELNVKVYMDINGNQQAVRKDSIPQELKEILKRYLQTYHI